MGNFEHAREVMVDTQLRPAVITDRKLLAAMGSTPRERFVPEGREAVAYVDMDHKLNDDGRYLPSAAVFGRMVQLAEVSANDVVLDVGCGSGYSCAILAELASAVVGIDNDPELVARANDTLADLDVGNAAVLEGDITAGVPSEAPFDVIILEGAVAQVPPALFQQLRTGGRLIAMVGMSTTATARVYVKTDRDVSERSEFNSALPNLLPVLEEPEFAL